MVPSCIRGSVYRYSRNTRPVSQRTKTRAVLAWRRWKGALVSGPRRRRSGPMRDGGAQREGPALEQRARSGVSLTRSPQQFGQVDVDCCAPRCGAAKDNSRQQQWLYTGADWPTAAVLVLKLSRGLPACPCDGEYSNACIATHGRYPLLLLDSKAKPSNCAASLQHASLSGFPTTLRVRRETETDSQLSVHYSQYTTS